MLTLHHQKREAYGPIDFDLNWDQCGWRPAAKWSCTRCLWSCSSWSCPPPIVTPLFSTPLEDSPSISLSSIHFPSHTHKLRRTETGKKWWVKRKREIRESVFTQPHICFNHRSVCLCACVWSAEETSDTSLTLTHSVCVDVPREQMCVVKAWVSICALLPCHCVHLTQPL